MMATLEVTAVEERLAGVDDMLHLAGVLESVPLSVVRMGER